MAKITLIGFYNYTEDSDPIFEDLELPEGIDKQVFIDSLLLAGGEFEVLYPDPYFLKNAITVWGQKWYRTFEKWVEALNIEYDPLNNYDRHEEWTTEGSTSTEASDQTSTNGSNSTTTNKSAYDSNTLTPYESISGTSAGSSTGSSSIEGSNNEDRTGHAWGNIGVTTSQQMLQAQLDISEWNLYQHMIDLFITELLLPIY